MFFVSEEFLREYESGEEPESTLDQAVPQGHRLFEKYEKEGERDK